MYWLNRIDSAIDPVEKNTCSAGFFFEGQAGSIESDVSVFRYEIVERHFQVGGNFFDLPVRYRNLSRPAAAIAAALALVVRFGVHVVKAHVLI